MKSTKKLLGFFAAAALTLSMFAGASAQVPTSAELGFEACNVEAVFGSEVNFDMTWNGFAYVADSTSSVVVDVTGVNLFLGPLCLIDVALEGGALNGPGPYTIQQNRMNASVPGQPGGDLGQSFALMTYQSHTINLEIDDLEGYHAPGTYTGTLNITVNTGA